MQVVNYMPLVHDARRLITQHNSGNRFVTLRVLADTADALAHAYLNAPNVRVASALAVELGRIETLI